MRSAQRIFIHRFAKNDFSMRGPMAWLLPSIDNCHLIEGACQGSDDGILFIDVVYDQATARDVLNLAESNALAPKLVDDRLRGLGWSAR